jgi:hypothetical protein
MRDRGRSEEKSRCAVNSKQKLTKNCEQLKTWAMGAGQRRRGAMLSIESKNQLKTPF